MIFFKTVILTWSSGVLLNNSLFSIYISRKRDRQIWETGEEGETDEDRLKIGGDGGRERERGQEGKKEGKKKGREEMEREGEKKGSKGLKRSKVWEREMGKEEKW